jgi:hypothetical protein
MTQASIAADLGPANATAMRPNIPSCLIELEDEQFLEPASRPAARNRDFCRRAGVTDDRAMVVDGEPVASPHWFAGLAKGDADTWVV